MEQQPTCSVLSQEEENQLLSLEKEFNVTWINGNDNAEEMLDQAIAHYLNSIFKRQMVKRKSD